VHRKDGGIGLVAGLFVGMDGKRPRQSVVKKMDDNVIKLVKDQFDVSYELAEFEQELKTAETFSSDKMQVQLLVAEIATGETVDHKVRLSAARVLLESSDIFPIFCKIEGGHEMLQEIIKEKMRDCIRH
jgi:hypothetical protein